jgi:hypothetical protein
MATTIEVCNPQQGGMSVSFHIVLLHRKAPQAWRNEWLDDSRPAWITTTPEIAMRLRENSQKSLPVRVHRLEWSGAGPAVCCECEVAAVREIDEHQYHVDFKNHRILELLPLVRPVRGQSSYEV